MSIWNIKLTISDLYLAKKSTKKEESICFKNFFYPSIIYILLDHMNKTLCFHRTIRAIGYYREHIILFTYRIGANTTALLIITASRINSNTKAPKLLNLNNTTAS